MCHNINIGMRYLHPDETQAPSLGTRMAAGAWAGLVNTVIVAPMELVKTQQQLEYLIIPYIRLIYHPQASTALYMNKTHFLLPSLSNTVLTLCTSTRMTWVV